MKVIQIRSHETPAAFTLCPVCFLFCLPCPEYGSAVTGSEPANTAGVQLYRCDGQYLPGQFVQPVQFAGLRAGGLPVEQ